MRSTIHGGSRVILPTFNQPSSFDASVLLEIPQRPTDTSLAVPPSLHEVHCVIKSLTNGKAPEVLKCGGMPLVHRSEHLFSLIWREEAVPQEFKDASIVHDASSDDSDVILDGRLF